MAELGTVVALIKSMSGADPAVIEQAVQDWLDDHPEATTTVQDGSITEAKLAQDVLAELGEIDELKEAIANQAVVRSAMGNPCSFSDGEEGTDIKELKANFLPVQDDVPSSEDPVTITGWEEVEVRHKSSSVVGSNLFDEEFETQYARYVEFTSSSSAKWKPSADSCSYCIAVEPNTTYSIISFNDNVAIFRACAIESDPATVGTSVVNSTNAFSDGTNRKGQLTTSSTEKWIAIQVSKTYGTNRSAKIMVVKGNQYPTAYEPYDPYDSYVASWTGELFGGCYDFITGKLWKTWEEIASYDGETLPGKWMSDHEVYEEGATPTTGAQVVYELAEPVLVDTLTGNAITVLEGINKIFSQTNGLAEVTYTANTSETIKEIQSAYVTPQMFGAKADGVTDDSDAIIQSVLSSGVVYFPSGVYGIRKTIFIGSNKVLFGDGDSSIIKLLDNGGNLTPHAWYPGSTSYPDYYPYFTTIEGAHDIKISRIRVEGNTEAASSNIHVGIATESAKNVLIEDCSVWKINYHLENAPSRPSGQWRTGWNIAALRSDGIEISRCVVQYGAYECVRIGTRTKNVYIHDCQIEYGWRTAFQVIEGCENIIAERLKIIQDDFNAYDTTACITMHPSESNPIRNVLIKDCYVEGKLWGDQGEGYAHNLYEVDKYCYNVVVDGCTFVGKGTVESVISGFRQLTVRNTVVDCSQAGSNTNGIGHSATVEAASENSDLIVENCKIYANNIAILIWGGYQKKIVIRGNYLETTSSHTIYHTATNPDFVMIEGNRIYAPNNKDGIMVDGGAMDGGIISGNIFLHGRYAIGGGGSGGVVNSLISGNTMRKTTSGINSNISGISSNVIADNVV